jgi:hypothetical protein
VLLLLLLACSCACSCACCNLCFQPRLLCRLLLMLLAGQGDARLTQPHQRGTVHQLHASSSSSSRSSNGSVKQS